MEQKYIQFKKQRDLGAIISDTFIFFRQNFKEMFKLLIKIAGPIFLIVILSLGYNTYIMGGTFDIFTAATGADQLLFIGSMFIFLISILVFYVLLYQTILYYIKSYIDHEGVINELEIKQNVKGSFGNFLGLFLLITISTIIGLLLFILPGIYISVPLVLAPSIFVFQRSSGTKAFSESFKLIKDHWWVTFGCLLVIFLLIYVISLIFQIPLMLYVMVKAFTAAQEGTLSDPSSLFDWVYLLLNVISSIFQYLLTVISVIAGAFIYFDLDEQKNLTGTYETISNLGSSENK